MGLIDAAASRSRYLLLKGTGIWGINIPVGWGFAIINFVWWIGIGHAGTLISAILLLLQAELAHVDQPVRRGDDALRGRLRAACSRCSTPAARGSRTGCSRIPNTMSIWPQFRSPLIWDVFAVSTYFTVSLLFWYIGLDARPGDAARPREAQVAQRIVYGMLALGWRGSARHWQRYETAYLLLAGLVDAAGALGPHGRELRLRGRHHPRLAHDDLPAVLRRGAIFSGFAMVLTLAIPLRVVYGLEDFITMRHLENMAQGHARDRAHRRLRLRDGGLLRLVQREQVRSSS